MSKRLKVTEELLEDVEDYGESGFSLEYTFLELNLSNKLMKDEVVLNAFDQGLSKIFVIEVSKNRSDEYIQKKMNITKEKCNLWKNKYSAEINELIKNKKRATETLSCPLKRGILNLVTQSTANVEEISYEVLKEDVNEMVNNIKNGNSSDLLTMLTTNVMQLQVFNTTVSKNLVGELGKPLRVIKQKLTHEFGVAHKANWTNEKYKEHDLNNLSNIACC